MRRGVSAAEPCGPALWRNVLSVVRKSRNSSGGIYRCHGPSAHDGRRTKAMRFLMNTLLAPPSTALDACLPAKTLSGYARSLSAFFVSSTKPRSRHPRLLAWRNYNSQSLGASSILLLKAAGTARYASEIPPCRHLRPIADGTFPKR